EDQVPMVGDDDGDVRAIAVTIQHRVMPRINGLPPFLHEGAGKGSRWRGGRLRATYGRGDTRSTGTTSRVSLRPRRSTSTASVRPIARASSARCRSSTDATGDP